MRREKLEVESGAVVLVLYSENLLKWCSAPASRSSCGP